MLPSAPIETLTLPALPPPPTRPGFPVAATLAPMIVSAGIWAATGSAYSLLFAVLGPVVAVGSMFDGRRQRRRATAREVQRTVAAFERLQVRVDSAAVRERARRELLAPGPRDAVAQAAQRWATEERNPGERWSAVRLGLRDDDPVVSFDERVVDDDAAPAIRAAATSLLNAAGVLRDTPWLEDARDGLGLVGPPSLGAAVARSVVLQLLARASPRTTGVVAPPDEVWLDAVPHALSRGAAGRYAIRSETEESVVAWAGSTAELPPDIGMPVVLDAGARFSAIGEAHAASLAESLAATATELGLAASRRGPPEVVHLAELLREGDRSSGEPGGRLAGGLRAPVGVDGSGTVHVDLVAAGPHAVVAGTTGSGKSELLVGWVLAIAARHPPTAVAFLLIDFKGGAAFAPLARLPHVVGTVTDLDARRSRRAIESLRAELRRRESMLAERGVRSIEELAGGLPRLVIVVDEFAAVVGGRPELHEVFADLAARGRSLGLHLVLCTQRPSGVIRDGVLANAALRISLRVTDRGDSTSMVGSDAAFALAPLPRGRAVMADGSGETRELQWAIAEPGDAALAWDGTPARPVWCEPLPEVIPWRELERDPEWPDRRGIVFGRADLPAEQRQPLACYEPGGDGHLLVLGAARSGRTTMLTALAADPRCRVLPGDPADAWTVLDAVGGGASSPAVLVIDDLDVLVDRFDPDARHEFADRLGRVLRESPGLRVVASAQRLTGPVQRLAGLFDSRMLLRQPNREEHVLAGGDGAEYDPRMPPGAGLWRPGGGPAVVVQIALRDDAMPIAALPGLPTVGPIRGRVLAVMAGRPREIEQAAAGRARIVRLGGGQVVHLDDPIDRDAAPSTVLLGDPDAWQADWSLLAEVRREHRFVVLGCTTAELRAVTRVRDAPPPLGGRPGECWLVERGEVRRAILEL